MENQQTRVYHLPDSEVLAALSRLHLVERATQAEFLIYLNEVEDRMLFAAKGYSSMFSFLVEHFHYSEASALKRIQVARLGRKFPEVYEYLSNGVLSLSHLQVLAPHMKQDNATSLLDTAQGKSVREIQLFLAGEFPKPEASDRIRASGEDRYKLEFTADQAFVDKLNHAKALLGRKHPSGRLVHILGEALDLLLESEGNRQCRPVSTGEKAFGITQEELDAQERQKDALQDPERKNTPRYIPRVIRREVWKRDGGKCQFKREDGTVCGETKYLEFDHCFPWAWGGSSHSSSNVRILCRAHNQWHARQSFRTRIF